MLHLFRAISRVKTEVAKASHLYVMLDYDGTLTPIVRDPKAAYLPAKTRELLRVLASTPRYTIAIVSGRRLKQLRDMVGVKRLYLMGNHGLEIEGPELNFTHPRAKHISHEMSQIHRELEGRIAINGALIENKGLTVSVHYRCVEPEDVPRIVSITEQIVKNRKDLRVTYGKKVVEVRSRVKWDKGRAAELLMNSLGDGLPIYFGDDYTDEDAFIRLKGGVTVIVSDGPVPSHAKYYVRGVNEVYRFLRLLASPVMNGVSQGRGHV
jgi:trehalose 6-phosphate phosphatase